MADLLTDCVKGDPGTGPVTIWLAGHRRVDERLVWKVGALRPPWRWLVKNDPEQARRVWPERVFSGEPASIRSLTWATRCIPQATVLADLALDGDLAAATVLADLAMEHGISVP